MLYLLANSELRDHVTVAVRIMRLQIIQQTATLAHEHQQATPRSMILRVGFKMLGQFANPLTQNRNLDLGGTGVRLMRPEALNQVSFLSSRQHGVSYSSFVSVHFSSVYCEITMNAPPGQTTPAPRSTAEPFFPQWHSPRASGSPGCPASRSDTLDGKPPSLAQIRSPALHLAPAADGTSNEIVSP